MPISSDLGAWPLMPKSAYCCPFLEPFHSGRRSHIKRATDFENRSNRRPGAALVAFGSQQFCRGIEPHAFSKRCVDQDDKRSCDFRKLFLADKRERHSSLLSLAWRWAVALRNQHIRRAHSRAFAPAPFFANKPRLWRV